MVYLRKQETFDGHNFPICYGVYGTDWRHPLTRPRVVGFCGTITPMLELYTNIDAEPHRCWSIEDVDQFMQDNLDRGQIRAYKSTRWVRGYNYRRRRGLFEQFFIACNQQRDKHEHLFHLHHTPVFVTGSKKLVINACLKDVGFFTQVDNYRAFQEIDMYMGGILGTHGGHKTKYKGRPMSSEVSDRDLAAAKGFDKHSFRSSK